MVQTSAEDEQRRLFPTRESENIKEPGGLPTDADREFGDIFPAVVTSGVSLPPVLVTHRGCGGSSEVALEVRLSSPLQCLWLQ